MNLRKLIDDYSKNTDGQAGLTVKAQGVVPSFPWVDVDTKAVKHGAVMYFTVKNTENENEHHVVLGCSADPATAGTARWGVWCGDSFLEGTPGSEKRLAQLEGLADAGAYLAHHGSLKKSHACNFWARHRQGVKAGEPMACKHVHFVARLLRDFASSSTSGQLSSDTLTTLEQLETKHVLGATQAATGVAQSRLGQMAFKVPVLFEGDRGSGKTHEARAFAKAHNLPLIMVGGNEGITATDLLGHLVRAPGGDFVWKDGALSRAFRLAQTGKVVLLIDELLRIPQRELSVLLTALSPFDDQYTLATGRMLRVENGVGVEEELQAPVSNLCVIATTNIGAEFAVDEIDPALAERFEVIRKDTDEDALKAILTQAVRSKGFPTTVVPKLLRFFRGASALVENGNLNRAPTTRTLVRAVNLASSEAEIFLNIQEQALLWVDRTPSGKPVKEQITSIHELVKRVM